MFLVSICIPTYNRQNELKRFFESIDYLGDKVEFVVCDDGSTDNTKALVEEYASRFNIRYLYQKNQGRAVALRHAIKHANGEFVMLMDSDDYFLPNALTLIIDKVTANAQHDCFIFGVKILKDNTFIDNLPPRFKCSNFISLRADYGIKRDLKEVVKTDLLKTCLYDETIGCRRVPTYLLWAKVAQLSDCLTISVPVAVKEYLPGGMSDKILQLKSTYAQPMVELYALLANTTRYKSNIYRWRSRLLWARYAFHAKMINFNAWWKPFIVPFGFGVYLLDKKKLKKLSK